MQLAGFARVASGFGVLYELLILRTAAVAIASVAGLFGRLVAASDTGHQGVLRVVQHYLQEVCNRCDSNDAHTEAKLRATSFASLPCRGQEDAYHLQQPVGVG